MEIENRVRILEDDRAIRDLKARYLRAADGKDIKDMRGCFLKDAVVEFEGFPRFEAREPFIETFQQMACVPGIFDIHHGANGVVQFENQNRATGQWSLLFHNINLEARTLTQMGVEYDDIFEKDDAGEWRIAHTRSRRTSALVHQIDKEGQPTVTVMGQMEAAFGK
ncbi:nuclear transport factor 2 family protein [Parasphingorhabdus sp. JC815]|uniref:nuclear transport factor 2 family protein n=1 Tax=Parasphingorhabdus sp. JC815 TaxID=3232140 RepID=UPI00345AB7B6